MGNKSILPEDLFFSRTSDFLDVFIVKQCGRSVKTKESYRDALTVFKRYVVYTGKSIPTFLYTDCTYGFLLDFKNYLSADLEYSPSSINQRLAVVKAYMRYSYGCNSSLLQTYITVNAVPFSPVPKIQRDILDEDSISALLSQPPATRKGLRDTLIMSLLFDAAIRLDELIMLSTADVYTKDGYTYLLIHGKGSKERKVSIDKRTKELLSLYLKEYHPGEMQADRPLIYTVIKGTLKAMSHRNVQKLLKKYAAQAAINNGQASSVHPHLLRRSRASGLYQNGTPIEIVSRFLGHSSIETTKDHYAFPSLEQMREATNKGRKTGEEEKPMWVGHEDELARLCGLR